MKVLRTIRNYLCYCGIEKDQYNAVKKDAYISNFKVWQFLHCVMTAAFAFMFIYALTNDMLAENRMFYLGAFVYSLLTTIAFLLFLKEDSIIAQLWIYLSISLLFLFAAFITQNSPQFPATTFIVMLFISPMFMIDKPFFMGIELLAANTIFLIWMYFVKDYSIWRIDLVDGIVFGTAGFLVHIVSNSIRIKEFVLKRTIAEQKDVDELTGLRNKGALTREINEFINDVSQSKGLLFVLDIDHFKSVNDTYGHEIGDSVLSQVGTYLGNYFTGDEIVGRFGGDEFIVLVQDTDDEEVARRIAEEIIAGVPGFVKLPDNRMTIHVSIGIALYRGVEKNYSEIFNKADSALYSVKANRKKAYRIHG